MDLPMAEPCQECGSRERREVDGFIECGNGHRQSDGPITADDDDEYNQQGRSQRAKEDRVKVKYFKAFRGERGLKLYLQAYQLVLWKQCYILIHEKGFPAEIWDIVKDLWALRLTKVIPDFEFFAERTLQGLEPHHGAERKGDPLAFVSDEHMPRLIETIGLCYIAIMLLRIPLSLSTLRRWVVDKELPWFDAYRDTPDELISRLPPYYKRALEVTDRVLQPGGPEPLQQNFLVLARYYNTNFGMTLPPVNHKILLLQFVKRLWLPIEVYRLATDLNERILKFDFRYETKYHYMKATRFPEAQIMSLIIVAVKLAYPWGVTYNPDNLNDPAAQRIDWKTWSQLRRSTAAENDNEDTTIKPGTEHKLKETDLFNMSGEKVDAYMDWYQRTFTAKHAITPRDEPHKDILAMFPLEDLSQRRVEPMRHEDKDAKLEQQTESALREMQASLRMNRTANDGDNLDVAKKAPGCMYPVFKHPKSLDKFKIAKEFHEAAAEVACLSLELLLRAVTVCENQIDTWRENKRREAIVDPEDVDDVEDGLDSDQVMEDVDGGGDG